MKLVYNHRELSGSGSNNRQTRSEAHLLDHVGNVGPGEGDVLESPSQDAVDSRVANGGLI
jgi:hypothetical protein